MTEAKRTTELDNQSFSLAQRHPYVAGFVVTFVSSTVYLIGWIFQLISAYNLNSGAIFSNVLTESFLYPMAMIVIGLFVASYYRIGKEYYMGMAICIFLFFYIGIYCANYFDPTAWACC